MINDRGISGVRTLIRGGVVSYHRQATEAGIAMLERGGNAFDAFVAATMAEYVVAEGGTSLAGSLGVLVYDANKEEIRYLDAEFNDVRSMRGRWRTGDPLGKALLVPGAPAGLEELSTRYGRVSFAECLQPAIRLARDGFPLTDLYCRNVELAIGALRSTEYGRRTFFRRGMPHDSGSTLRQPDLAALLERLARSGAAEMYRGAWGAEFVKAARAQGSFMKKRDLRAYGATWHEPWRATYRGYTVYTCSGRTFGGLWTLLGLKVLEYADLARLGHFSASSAALEMLTRTIRELWQEYWLFDYRLLADEELITARLSAEYGARLWTRVREAAAVTARARAGSHSYHIIAIDGDGNVASGTNTHESLAWGSGVFVQGVPLPASGYLPWSIRPGERRLSPFAIALAFEEGALRFATGAFASSILEASLQFLINLLEYGLPPRQAATLARVGTYPHDPADYLSAAAGRGNANTVAEVRNWLDARVPADIVAQLERRGLDFAPSAAWRRRTARRHERTSGAERRRVEVDTGLGALLSVSPDGILDGAVAPWPGAADAPDLFKTTNGRSGERRGDA